MYIVGAPFYYYLLFFKITKKSLKKTSENLE